MSSSVESSNKIALESDVSLNPALQSMTIHVAENNLSTVQAENDSAQVAAPTVFRAKRSTPYPRLGGGRQRSYKLSGANDRFIDMLAAEGQVSRAEVVRTIVSSFAVLYKAQLNATETSGKEVGREKALVYLEAKELNDPEGYALLMERILLGTGK